jgi:FlaA1/EpsC-like NDP-sugar epimerase
MGRSAKAAIDADVRSEGYAVAYIEDDPNKLGKTINGLPIVTAELALSEDFVKRNNIRRVVLAAKSIGAARIKALTQQALEVGLEVKRVPPIGQWVNGELTATQIRTVSVEDLLGRDPIHLSYESLEGFIAGKVVLITGAAGSIGSELVRQVLRQKPARLLALDQAETPLYQLDLECNTADGIFLPIVGSVADASRMEALFAAHTPQVVFHAAAYKHVPLMEAHPQEAIQTNCIGTSVMARLAREHGAEAFVMVSTDKAVNPTNVMGATKRVAEHVVQAENRHPQNRTRFVTTRFGNVLGSNGSVIPLFQKQIAQGGPVTITHKEITRFFMTIPEAVRLVLEAGHMGRGGELYVFDMGEPVRIYDLALNLIKLSGLKPGHDIAVREVGLRPGEKLYEELLADHENTVPTHHPKIFIAKATSWTDDDFTAHWTHLHTSLTDAHPAALRDALKRLVPEFVGESYS